MAGLKGNKASSASQVELGKIEISFLLKSVKEGFKIYFFWWNFQQKGVGPSPSMKRLDYSPPPPKKNQFINFSLDFGVG